VHVNGRNMLRQQNYIFVASGLFFTFHYVEDARSHEHKKRIKLICLLACEIKAITKHFPQAFELILEFF
jgi:hypothetical protein